MAQTMKALVKRETNKGIWLEQVPVPTPGPNEVLIKLEKTAICGTDLHIYLWDEWSQRTIKPGLTIGHEFVGRVAELGSAVTGYQVGQRVSAEGTSCAAIAATAVAAARTCAPTPWASASTSMVPSPNTW